MPLSQINSASIENASIAIVDLSATGTPSSSTFLRGDNTWSAPSSPSGSVIQVVATTLTSAFSSSTKAAWVSVTGLSATITPVSTSSRILVMVQLSTGDGGNNYARTWAVARNGTLINQSTVGTGYVQGSFSSSLIGSSSGSNNAIQTVPFTYLDSPASTSALTYQVQFNAYTASVTTTNVNRSYAGGATDSNCTSNIILMEIA